MRIFIITEALPTTGMGHLTRCIALYDLFVEKGFAPMLVINGTNMAMDYADGKDALFFDWTKDAQRLISVINGSDIAIVDSYLADKDIYEKISESVKTAIFLDDYIRIAYPKGIVVNGTILAYKFNYPANHSVSYLLGSKYIMLRKEFLNTPSKVINDDVKKILITIGGSDIQNLTPQVVKIVSDYFPDIEQLIVTQKERFSALQMRNLMIECDIAISAAGQTINELASCGTPSIVFKVADNQKDNIEGWSKLGFISGESSLESLKHDITKLLPKDVRVKLSRIGRENVDGLGAERIVNAALQSCFLSSLTLRNANYQDIMPLFELANDPVVRFNSFNSAPISLEIHKTWFEKILTSDTSLLYIFDIGGEFAAQVRFDIKIDEVVTNVSICKKFRGYGLGCEILKKAISDSNFSKPITAYIKSENLASQRIFECAGYKKIEDQKWIIEHL